MRIKALLALLGLGLALLVFAGCSDSEDNNNVPAGFQNITGTVTNASTGLGQPNATVTLLRNGEQVGEPFVTGNSGEFTFTNIPEGSGYTIRVSSATNAFQTVTTDTFTLDENTPPFEIIVGSGITGVTVSGIVGTTDTSATFTVNAVRNGNVIATTTTGTTPEGQNGPSFTLTNVPVGADTTLVVTSAQHPGVVTVFGPIDIPQGGLTGINIFTKTAQQVMTDTGNQIGTIPPPSGKAAVSAYITGGGTITVGNQTSNSGNPAFLNNLTASNTLTTATIDPVNGDPFTVQFVPASGTVTVFRFPNF